ncbi:MAG: metalloregulator ArsR/SmtB family transcription factor [Candidatus Bathyarchaeota archaeon]|nr:metalloregulator ArsR/SmtB family transcription factor [Candidatus Bathyarchaeota archaeon]
MSEPSDSLRRLVSTGKGACCNVEDYVDQLREVAEKVADPKTARLRGRFFKALGDDSRQRILGLLTVREMCVCELMSALDMTQPTTSHHLKILEDAGLIASRKDGKWVFYSLPEPGRVKTLLELVG